MNKEEQVAFFAERDSVIGNVQLQLDRVLAVLEDSKGVGKLPLYEITEFKSILDSISGYGELNSVLGGHVNALKVPLFELREFKSVLDTISGHGQLSTVLGGGHVNALKVPLFELQEFERALKRIGDYYIGAIHNLKGPLADIREYEETLDRIIEKSAKVRTPNGKVNDSSK